MTVRHRFSARVGVGAEVAIVNRETGEMEFARSRTKQSMKEEVNINNILAKYVKTGTIAHLNRYGATYGFAPAVDFKGAMELIERGRSMFADLPAKVRRQFDNDPQKFLTFVQDEKNLDAMREMGLAKPKEAPAEPPKPAATSASAQ